MHFQSAAMVFNSRHFPAAVISFGAAGVEGDKLATSRCDYNH